MNLYFTQIEAPSAGLGDPLARKGWRLCHLPFRRVVFDSIRVDPVAWDVWILTSKNAARWLVQQGFTNLPALAVVGEATASLLPAEKMLFDKPVPANAAELTALLRSRQPPLRRVLFLRGEKARPLELPAYCEHIVYRTVTLLQKAKPPERRSMVYFQAPSTVVDYCHCYQVRPGLLGVIGPSTAEVVRRRGWSIDFQPPRPENTYFVNALPPAEDFATRIGKP